MLEPVSRMQGADWRLPDAAFLASFSLPTDRSAELARMHPMPREDRIKFDEASYVYTVDGAPVPVSEAGFMHAFTHEFDPLEAIQSMQRGPRWPERRAELLRDDGEYMAPAEIAARWASNGEVQRTRGTLLRYHAEQACNGRSIEEPHSLEFQQLRVLLAAIKHRWEIYRLCTGSGSALQPNQECDQRGEGGHGWATHLPGQDKPYAPMCTSRGKLRHTKGPTTDPSALLLFHRSSLVLPMYCELKHSSPTWPRVEPCGAIGRLVAANGAPAPLL